MKELYVAEEARRPGFLSLI